MAKVDPDPASGGRPSTEEFEEPRRCVRPERRARPGRRVCPAGSGRHTMGEYVRAQLQRIRGGESGVLPVFVGLIVIVVVFQVTSPNGVFLTAGNIVNLFQQSAVFMVLSMAEIFVLLLGEIDLSLGYLPPWAGPSRCSWCSPPPPTGPGGPPSRRGSDHLRLHRRRLGHVDHPAAAALLHRHPRRTAHPQRRACCRGARPLLRIPQPQREVVEPAHASTTSCGAG